MKNSKFLLVTTVKDEGPFILEWVAWHRLCGFDRIMIFENNSSDLTRRSLKVLRNHGLIDFVPNDRGRGSPQVRAYKRAAQTEAYAETDWCLTIDGDEFFVSHVGKGTVGELVDRVGDVDSVLINWRNFGSSGHLEMSDALTAERFTRTTPTAQVATQLTGFKTLHRTASFGRMGIHNAREPKKDRIVRVNGSGLPEDQFGLLNWRCTDPGQFALAQINHFPIRDVASFVIKTQRGRAHQSHNDDWRKYWLRFDHNAVEDRTLANRAEDIRAEMSRIDDMTDGRLMLIRQKSLRLWQKKLAAALQDPEIRAFRDEIAGTVQEHS